MDNFFEFLPTHILLKWILLLAPLFFLATWHHYQHSFFKSFAARPNATAYAELLKAMRWRAVQIAGLWLVAVALVVSGDMRYYEIIAGPEAVESADVQAEDESVSVEDALEPLDFTPQQQANITQQQVVAQDAAMLEATLDEIKFRYEDAFVSYLYLQRCKQVDINDLSRINEALARELAQLGADPSVQYSIYSAAQGSFEGVYSDTPCDSSYITPMLAQFTTFMQKIR